MSSQQDQAAEGSRLPGSPRPVSPAAPGPVPPSPASRAPAGPGGPGAAGAGAPGTAPARPAWKTAADGTTVFRLIAPLVLWWVWVAFAVANLIDLAVQSPDLFSIKVAAALLIVTGAMYACTLHAKVVSDAGGLTICNPFRDYRVPWGGVEGVFLGDSVEVQCQRTAPKKSKTVYAWALYSPRRSRAKAELRAGLGNRRARNRHDDRARRRYQVPNAHALGAMPDQGKDLASQHPSHAMAGELARRREQARRDGAPAGVLSARWAWPPIAAVIVPAAALAATIAIR